METSALTAEETEFLSSVYHTRKRLFLLAFAGIAFMIIRSLGFFYEGDDPKLKKFDYEYTGNQVLGACYVFMFTILFLPAVFIYLRRVHSYKKDIRNGIKEALRYRVIRKSYFEHTGQYFVSFDDPNYMHYEVDSAFYSACEVGDIATVFRAPFSKHVFDQSGRFSLM